MQQIKINSDKSVNESFESEDQNGSPPFSDSEPEEVEDDEDESDQDEENGSEASQSEKSQTNSYMTANDSDKAKENDSRVDTQKSLVPNSENEDD